ncbi:hypothetical protein SELMODRAFT_413459 [Selaginella moellendorffii]|uniref:Uncharacterized protein n=1 Tax=Selaginella moellendorffii TaxID=88036 RepID=D8RPJ0_SELML|nr:hypothetical protein SELMODRAFT_413459 [Selaginella moellendorffii]
MRRFGVMFLVLLALAAVATEVEAQQQCFRENACLPGGLSCNSYCKSCHFFQAGQRCVKCKGGSCTLFGRCICDAPCSVSNCPTYLLSLMAHPVGDQAEGCEIRWFEECSAARAYDASSGAFGVLLGHVPLFALIHAPREVLELLIEFGEQLERFAHLCSQCLWKAYMLMLLWHLEYIWMSVGTANSRPASTELFLNRQVQSNHLALHQETLYKRILVSMDAKDGAALSGMGLQVFEMAGALMATGATRLIRGAFDIFELAINRDRLVYTSQCYGSTLKLVRLIFRFYDPVLVFKKLQALVEAMGISSMLGPEAIAAAERNADMVAARAGAGDPSAMASICRIAAASQYSQGAEAQDAGMIAIVEALRFCLKPCSSPASLLENLARSINLVQTLRDLVGSGRALLTAANISRPDYEKTANACAETTREQELIALEEWLPTRSSKRTSERVVGTVSRNRGGLDHVKTLLPGFAHAKEIHDFVDIESTADPLEKRPVKWRRAPVSRVNPKFTREVSHMKLDNMCTVETRVHDPKLRALQCCSPSRPALGIRSWSSLPSSSDLAATNFLGSDAASLRSASLDAFEHRDHEKKWPYIQRPCTSYSQELPKKKATLVSIDETVMTGASKEPAQQYADQMLHYELENYVGKDAVEVRTESACKESYSGDDKNTPQIVEMKMMMLNMKSQYRQQMTTTGKGHINVKLLQLPTMKEFSLVTSNQAKQNVDFLKKQMQKLKQDKEKLSRELFPMKKKQRQSEKQKKSLDDALDKVSG